jgi:DNA-binding beta-propeller fold protein YncE
LAGEGEGLGANWSAAGRVDAAGDCGAKQGMTQAAAKVWGSGYRGCTPWVAVAACCALGACGHAPTGETPEPIHNAREIGGLGDTPGRFAYPRCIDHDAEALWVIDKSARVQRIDPATGKCLALFHMPEWELGKPTGFCIAPGPDKDGHWCDDLLYIADTHYHRVMVYKAPKTTPEGDLGVIEPVGHFGEYGTGPGQFFYPTDVAVLLKEGKQEIDRIYVSEYGGNDRINVFDGKHAYLYSFGVEGSGNDASKIELNRPQAMVIRTKSDGAKELVVTDACNHRLGRFTLDGKLIGWISSPANQGRKPGQFSYPYGLVILPDGTAMVSEFGGARAQRINIDTGATLGCWGEPGREPGQVLAPWGVTALNGSVYLLDSGNNRITAFSTPR